MAELHLTNIKPVAPEVFANGSWLLLLKPEAVPPHLALTHSGRWYSVTYKEVELGISASDCLARLARRTVPMVGFELGLEIQPHKTFTRAKSLIGNSTCLDAIKATLANAGVQHILDAESIHQVVPQLIGQQLVGRTVGCHLPREVEATLPAYTRADVLEAIRQLKNRKPRA